MTRSTVPAPPRLAERALSLVCAADERPYVLSDFRDAFRERLDSRGVAAARAWYWREVARSLAPLALCRLESRHRRVPAASNELWSRLAGDARFALRLTHRAPLPSIAVVATVALGIAATTAVLSVTDAVLLRPLPFAGSERVVRIDAVMKGGRAVDYLAYPDLMDFRRLVHEFSNVTVFSPTDVTLQHGTNPQLLHTVQVDAAYASVFAIRPELGRLIVPADTLASAPNVVVLTHQFWAREFGADSSIVGKTIHIDDVPVEVVGVLAADAYVVPHHDIEALTPLRIPAGSFRKNRGAMWANAAARLGPAASIEQAQRDLASVAAMIRRQYAIANHDIGARIQPLRDAVIGPVRPMLELLTAAIAAVLLIACVNIANLILGRAQARSREFAVRSALGGSPSRVRFQVFVESLMLAAIGGAVGAALAPVLTRGFIAAYPDALPRADEVSITWAVALAAMALTIAAGLLSAAPAARRVARLDLTQDLRAGARSGERRTNAGRVLVVTQVAASLALLFAAGLLAHTFVGLTRVNPGFDARNTVSFFLQTPNGRYRKNADVVRYYDQTIAALRAIPGVRDVSTTTLLPFGNCCNLDTFVLEDRGDVGVKNPQAEVSGNAPDFERALGIPLLRGRSFTAHDDSTSAHVVMINAEAAKRFYPGKDPIGELLTWNGEPHWRIVGVVGTTHLGSLSEDPLPVLYVPTAQAPFLARFQYVVIRSARPPAEIVSAARLALHRIDPTIPLVDVATMEERVSHSLDAQRFRAALMGSLGALALVLALIGIYGVIAYSVSRRTREIGIRMALGEAAHAVRRRVVLDAFRLASVGLVIGVVLSLLAGKWLASFLVGVAPYDVGTLIESTGLIMVAVLAAAYGPARRAARVDPIRALRAE